MRELWARLERLAQTHGKTLGLRPGVAERKIAAAEKAMKLKLPADYRESLALHDGQAGEWEWLPGCDALKPLADVVERWTYEQSLAAEYPDTTNATEGPIHTVLWHPKRIPIAGNAWWDGDNTYVDLHPSSSGSAGQIITFHTECDLVCLGASMRDAMEQYLAAMESGDWVYSPTKQCVVPKSEPRNRHPNRAYAFSEYVHGRMRRASKATLTPRAKAKASTSPKSKATKGRSQANAKAKGKAKRAKPAPNVKTRARK